MKKRALILNIEVSGMNKYLFAQLRERGWDLIICDVPLPKRLRYWAMFISFRLPVADWKKAFDCHLNKLYKSSWCFKWRTRQCEKILQKYHGQYSLVINMTGMSAPFLKRDDFFDVKYVVITSYTMALSRKYEEWCTYLHEYQKWVDLERQLYQEADVIFTTNENARHSLRDDYGIDYEKTIKMGYGLTFDKVPEFEKIYNGKTILFVGFDFKRKGGFVLLDAFKQVRSRIPDAKLIIIGPNKDIYKIKQEGVEFLGPIKDRERVKEYFKSASVFAMPSLCEPFGLVFLEAMAYKLPCIASTVDAMPEIIVDGKTGYLVHPDDIDELADKIVRLLSDHDGMGRMGQNAYDRVTQVYAWDQVGNIVNQRLLEVQERDQ